MPKLDAVVSEDNPRKPVFISTCFQVFFEIEIQRWNSC